MSQKQRLLFILNILTTITRMIWCILVLGIVYVWVVSLSNGLVGNLLNDCNWYVNKPNPYQEWLLINHEWLLISSLVFLVISAFVEIVRLLLPSSLKQLLTGADGEKGLLTWKKLREKWPDIVRSVGSVLGVVLPTLLVFVGFPLVVDLSQANTKTVQGSLIVQFMYKWITGQGLAHWLAVDTIGVFIILSFAVYILARNLRKQGGIAAVKEWEHIHDSLKAVSEELKQLQTQSHAQLVKTLREGIEKRLDYDQKVLQRLEAEVQQLRKPISPTPVPAVSVERRVEALEKQLDAEQKVRQRLETEVQQLRKQINPTPVPAVPDISLDQEPTQKLRAIT